MTQDLTGIDERPNGKHRVRIMFRGERLSEEFATVEEAVRFRDAIRARIRDGKAATVEEAVRFRDAIRARIRDGKAAPVEGMSLRQVGPAFLERRKLLRNYVTDRSRWNVHILTARFADRPMRTIERRDILEWLDDLETKRTADRRDARPLSRQLRKHCRNLLSACFDYCVDRGALASNPARGVKI